MAKRGINVAAWRAPIERSVAVGADRWTAATEDDPLHILEMGNYFDTCLSVGQMNDFSTIANAVEINRRVLYLRNRDSTVLGRKMALLDPEGEIYGFYSYGSGLK